MRPAAAQRHYSECKPGIPDRYPHKVGGLTGNRRGFTNLSRPDLHPIAWRSNIGEGNEAQPLRQTLLPASGSLTATHPRSGTNSRRIFWLTNCHHFPTTTLRLNRISIPKP